MMFKNAPSPQEEPDDPQIPEQAFGVVDRRDWFAGMALQGILSFRGSYGGGEAADELAFHCATLADAMIAALDETAVGEEAEPDRG